MARRGIDISAHQGNINLRALKNQIDFVIYIIMHFYYVCMY